jgi:hypothetical protein
LDSNHTELLLADYGDGKPNLFTFDFGLGQANRTVQRQQYAATGCGALALSIGEIANKPPPGKGRVNFKGDRKHGIRERQARSAFGAPDFVCRCTGHAGGFGIGAFR